MVEFRPAGSDGCPQDCHGILSGFADTYARAFPLLLVIGREPNTEKRIINCQCNYDFRAAPHCGFWNTSYGMIARLAGCSTREVKDKCIELSASPLLYADSLPIGIHTTITDKGQQRSEIPPEQVRVHMANLFAFDPITRVRLIITSGLYSPTFDNAKAGIEEHGQSLDIPVCHVPFFYGTNTAKIQAALTKEHKEIIYGVWKDFVTQ